MKERLFRFKQFNVSHACSALPVGVDGVLVGAWTGFDGMRILDAGTGCGVIALMMAQRNPGAHIFAVDTHLPSVEEASRNFAASPWGDRLKAEHVSFLDIKPDGGLYDVIVSNPPFFDSGADSTVSARTGARHMGVFSPYSLLGHGAGLLSEAGVISMILPATEEENLLAAASLRGMRLRRRCIVRDHEGAQWKRVLMEFGKYGETAYEELTMFDGDREPTSRYRELCGQFYLKF